MLRAAGVALFIALVSFSAIGCGSVESKLADLDLEKPDAEAKRDALVWLLKRARTSEDRTVATQLYEKAKVLAESEKSEDVSVRVVALRVLGQLALIDVNVPDTTELLARRSGDPTKGAAQGFEPEHWLKLGKEPSFWCRIEAEAQLGELARASKTQEVARPKAVNVLKTSITPAEDDHDVRIHAARELALLADQPGQRPESALPELVAALSDETPDVRWHVRHALIAIAGEDKGTSREDWELWRKSRPEPEAPK